MVNAMDEEELHISPEQCRAARGFLGWTRETLATRSKVSHRGLHNFETGQSTLNPELRQAIRQAFEKAGIRFTFDIGEGLYRPRK